MDEAHKYSIENIDQLQVHVKELRRTLKPGEKKEWEGVLTEGTKRLQEKKLLLIKDLGVIGKAKEAPRPTPKVKPAPKIEVEAKEAPKAEVKPKAKEAPKAEIKSAPKPTPKVEVKPAPKAEVKVEPDFKKEPVYVSPEKPPSKEETNQKVELSSKVDKPAPKAEVKLPSPEKKKKTK